MLGTAYLDDSSDPTGKVVFVAAGFFCIEEEWKRLRREWRKILKPHRIQYFRASDCRNLTHEFAKLRQKWGDAKARKVADNIRTQLEALMMTSPFLVGFGIGIDLQEFQEVDAMPEARANTKWMRECHDYKTAAYRNIFHHITFTVVHDLDGENFVSFVCDDSSDYRRIKRGYDRVKIKFPDLGKRMLTIIPLDDKKVPALQMADLMADVARDMVTRALTDPNIQHEPKGIKDRVLSVQCWRKEGMLKVLKGEALGV